MQPDLGGAGWIAGVDEPATGRCIHPVLSIATNGVAQVAGDQAGAPLQAVRRPVLGGGHPVLAVGVQS